jgi:hypothetical protein
MQVGSKVEYVQHFDPFQIFSMMLSGWKIKKFPDLHKTYTIREIWKCKGCNHWHIYVEEVIIGYTELGTEISTFGEQWRELQPSEQKKDEWVDEIVEKIIKETKTPKQEPEPV